MPDGANPGPAGAGCVERIAVPPRFWANEGAATAQSGIVERVVGFAEGDEPAGEPPAEPTTRTGARFPLTETGRWAGATTQDPHIHERWSESRKLELSYCINGMPGEDAENLASYHKMIRALNSTMAEWERVSGANFVHVWEDDTLELDTFVVLQGNQLLARADCVPGTEAYFGVVSLLEVPQGVTNAVPQAYVNSARLFAKLSSRSMPGIGRPVSPR